ncbi:branched-chain amino acid ABC transporter substrate-binding protein [Segnochrobactraceae bacterium EtOH-i3]
MKAVVATALAAASLLGTTALASADPLKIAIIESLSGSQTSTGRLYATASHYVIDKLNAAGGYNGEPIIVTEYDSGGNTAGASAKFKQAVADGANIVIQGSSSAIAGQISEDVRKHNLRNKGSEVLFLNVGGEAMELTGDKCHFHAFRFTTTAPIRVGALVSVMKDQETLGTRVYSINQNYSWGQDMQKAIEADAQRGGYEVVETVLHDVNRIQDFSPFVAKIQAAKPDTVITGNWSNDLLLLMKATGDSGLKVRFGTAFLDQPGNIGNAGEVAIGHYVAHPYNIELSKTSFPQDYEKVTGHLPTYVEPGTVNGLTMLGKALDATSVKGGKVDADKIALALEGVTLDTDIGTLSMRKADHQVLLPVVVSEVSRDVKYPVDGTDMGFKPVKVIPADQATYPAQDSCQMKRPS